MARKQFFMIVDTETTIADTVADFAAIVVDRKGRIVDQIAVLVQGEFGVRDLFWRKDMKDWSREYAERKQTAYSQMLNTGSRSLATVGAINCWLAAALAKYSPTLTAYNLQFDLGKCANTGIDLSRFADRFCLWNAAATFICHTKAYRQFVVENHLFNNRTERGNMTYKTDAESVCGFVRGEYQTEPHTALEDARDFELPILQKIANRKSWRDGIKSYSWNDFQVRDWFIAK